MPASRSRSTSPSRGPPIRVVERQPADDRLEILVAVVDRKLELDPRPGFGAVERDAGEGDVALEHRRVHQARRVADLAGRVVVDVVLVLDRRVILRRDEPRLVVVAIVVTPVEDEPGQLPARGPIPELPLDRRAGAESAIVVCPGPGHPTQAPPHERRAGCRPPPVTGPGRN